MKRRLDASGVHLFERSTGLNVLFDEVRPDPDDWSPAPRYVSVALTNACDLRCPYCYAPKHSARLHHDGVLRWLADLAAGGCLGVGFGGGEPTLVRGFAKLCARVASETDLAVSFTTHGHRLTADLAEGLRGSVHFIRVSIDGTGEVYEHLRGRPFDGVAHQLQLVRSIAPFGINMVVNDDTLPELDATAVFASEQSAVELLLLPEQPVGGKGGISARAREALAMWIAQNAGHHRLAISESGIIDGMPLARPFLDDHPLTAHAHITADGVLKASSHDDGGVSLEDLPILDALAELHSRETATA